MLNEKIKNDDYIELKILILNGVNQKKQHSNEGKYKVQYNPIENPISKVSKKKDNNIKNKRFRTLDGAFDFIIKRQCFIHIFLNKCKKNYTIYSKKELIKFCKEKNITISDKATKNDLCNLLKNNNKK